jgi:hypothetical protein
MSVNIWVDTIFVGQWGWLLAITAVTEVVLPIIDFVIRNGNWYRRWISSVSSPWAKDRRRKQYFDEPNHDDLLLSSIFFAC